MRQIKLLIKKMILDEEVRNYLIFGVLATILHLFLYFVLRRLDYSEFVSNIIAIVVTMNFAFVTNKIWVFKSRNFEVKVLVKEYYLFILGRIFTMAVDVILFGFLLYLHLVAEWVNRGVVSVVVIVLNYILSKKGAFKKASIE